MGIRVSGSQSSSLSCFLESLCHVISVAVLSMTLGRSSGLNIFGDKGSSVKWARFYPSKQCNSTEDAQTVALSAWRTEWRGGHVCRQPAHPSSKSRWGAVLRHQGRRAHQSGVDTGNPGGGWAGEASPGTGTRGKPAWQTMPPKPGQKPRTPWSTTVEEHTHIGRGQRGLQGQVPLPASLWLPTCMPTYHIPLKCPSHILGEEGGKGHFPQIHSRYKNCEHTGFSM